jgi:hypothetical protein
LIRFILFSLIYFSSNGYCASAIKNGGFYEVIKAKSNIELYDVLVGFDLEDLTGRIISIDREKAHYDLIVKLNGEDVSRDLISYNARRYTQKNNSILPSVSSRMMVVTVKNIKLLKDSTLSIHGSISYDVINNEKHFFDYKLSSLEVGSEVLVNQYSWSVIGVTNKTITFKIDQKDKAHLFFESNGKDKKSVINRSSYQQSYSMVHSLSVSFEESLDGINSWGVIKNGTPQSMNIKFQRDLRLPF